MSRRRIAKNGTLIAFGILMLAALVAWLQFLSCNLEDSEREGSWVARCWVFEEEDVPIGPQGIRVDTH